MGDGRNTARTVGGFVAAVAAGAAIALAAAGGSHVIGTDGPPPVVRSARVSAEVVTCSRSAIGCAPERDADGRVSVYGRPVAAATFYAGPAEDSPATVGALHACQAAGFARCDYAAGTVTGTR